MKSSILRSALLSVAMLVISSSAMAQYVWLDDSGAKQFSDQPPPANIPKNHILKFAGRTPDSQTALDADVAGSAPAKAPPSLAEQEMEYKKRHQEQVAKQQKEEEAAKNAAIKADSCRRQRDYKQSLDSGMRIAQTDANGNRSFLTDDKRAEEQATVNQYLATCN